MTVAPFTLAPTQAGDTNANMVVTQIVDPMTVDSWKDNAGHIGSFTSTSGYVFRSTVAFILGPISSSANSNNDPSIGVLDISILSVVPGPTRRLTGALRELQYEGGGGEEEEEEEETEASARVKARRGATLRRRMQAGLPTRAPSPPPFSVPTPMPTYPVPTISPTRRPSVMITYQLTYHPRTMMANSAADGYNAIMGVITASVASQQFTLVMRQQAAELSNWALLESNCTAVYASNMISTLFPTPNPTYVPTLRPSTLRPSPLPTRAAGDVLKSYFTTTDIIIAVVVVVFVVALLTFFYYACFSPKAKVIVVRSSLTSRSSGPHQRPSVQQNPMYPKVLPKNVYGGSGYQGPADEGDNMSTHQDAMYPSQQDMTYGYGHSQTDNGATNRQSRGSLSRSSLGGERRYSAHNQVQQMMGLPGSGAQRRLSETQNPGMQGFGDDGLAQQHYPPNYGL